MGPINPIGISYIYEGESENKFSLSTMVIIVYESQKIEWDIKEVTTHNKA